MFILFSQGKKRELKDLREENMGFVSFGLVGSFFDTIVKVNQGRRIMKQA